MRIRVSDMDRVRVRIRVSDIVIILQDDGDLLAGPRLLDGVLGSMMGSMMGSMILAIFWHGP